MLEDLVKDVFVQYFALAIFIIAISHTFVGGQIKKLSHKFNTASFMHHFLEFISEVEVVFGFWALIFFVVLSFKYPIIASVEYLGSLHFTEPIFVFVVMVMASTKPLTDLSQNIISFLAKNIANILRININIVSFALILILGPLLGSFITEPAAITVTALLIRPFLDKQGITTGFKYIVLALLFVNVSIGGTLTNFAAPPVLMVAKKWDFSNSFMFFHYGIKSMVVIVISTLLVAFLYKKDIIVANKTNNLSNSFISDEKNNSSPIWMTIVHLIFLSLLVVYHEHLAFFLSLFLIFLGWCEITKEKQTTLKIKEGLLAGFFLAGLVTVGNLQTWWLEPAIRSLSDAFLFVGASLLTGITDNAALTYLGSLVPDLSDNAKYLLLAGSVSGGGLTVIANAPNPIGYTILRDCFGENGVKPLNLLLAASGFTIFVGLAFWFVRFS